MTQNKNNWLSKKKIIRLIVFACLLWAGFWCWGFFFKKPKPVTDFIAIYEAQSKPDDFNETLNAASLYDKADSMKLWISTSDLQGEFFQALKLNQPEAIVENDKLESMDDKSYDSGGNDTNNPYSGLNDFIDLPQTNPMPKPLKPGVFFVYEWDMVNLPQFEDWRANNLTVFELLREASKRPYAWWPVELSENVRQNPLSLAMGFDRKIKPLIEAMALEVIHQYNSSNYTQCLSDIVVMYRCVGHLLDSDYYLGDQYTGMKLFEKINNFTLQLLYEAKFSDSQLAEFQATMANIYGNDYKPGLSAEWLYFNYIAQQLYHNKKNDKGRIAYSMIRFPILAFFATHDCCDSVQMRWDNFKEALIGPRLFEIKDSVKAQNEVFAGMIDFEPFEINAEVKFEKIEKLGIDSWLRKYSFIRYSYPYYKYYDYVAGNRATLSLVGIVRYKVNFGKWPQSLADVASADFLSDIPTDPYSGRAMGYILADDEPVLCSIGKDAVNDSEDLNWLTEYEKRKAEYIKTLQEQSPAKVLALPGNTLSPYKPYRRKPKDILFWPEVN